MQTARNVLSPAKQNQLIGKSPIKGEYTNVKEILHYLKEQGIKLPNYLTQRNPQQVSLKLIPIKQTNTQVSQIKNGQKQLGQIKTLKIKLSDTQFQLKKVEQDFAQFKRNTKNQKQRQQKKWLQTLQRLKQDSKQNSQDYDFTKKQQQQKYIQQIDLIKSQNLRKLQKLQKQLILKHNHQINQLKQKSINQFNSFEIQKSKQYKELHRQLTEEINKIKQDHQRQLYDLNLRNKEKLDAKDKKFQSIIVALQSQKKTQEKLHQKTKSQGQKDKQRIYSQLCYERTVKKNLEDEVAEKSKLIKQLKQTISDIKIQGQIHQQNWNREKQCLNQQHENTINHLNQKQSDQLSKILKSHKSECIHYQNQLSKLQSLHIKSQQLHQIRLTQLSQKYQQRQSKKQDLDQLMRMTDILVRKDEEIKRINRELRYRNLEIQNKEEVYNKIFKSTHKMKEQRHPLNNLNKIDYPTSNINKLDYPNSNLERDCWSKQSLIRKSQTTDIKFILRNMKTKKQKKQNKAITPQNQC